MRALILAGGAGTRLRPLTDATPKPMVELCGEPYAAGLLRRLAGAGVRQATFCVAGDPGPFAALEPLAADLDMVVAASTEEHPLDTAGAVRRLLADAPDPDEAVLVCNGDVLTDVDLPAVVAAHGAAGVEATLVLTEVDDTSSFGVVTTGPNGLVTAFVEKPPAGTVADRTVNAGTYVLTPRILGRTPGDGPLSFEREVFPGALAGGGRLLGWVSDAHWADLGTPRRHLDGVAAIATGRCAWPVAPEVRIDSGIVRHASAEVAAGAELIGPTALGPGTVVAAGARLVDCEVHVGAHVGPGASLEGVIVGPGAHVAADTTAHDAVLV